MIGPDFCATLDGASGGGDVGATGDLLDLGGDEEQSQTNTGKPSQKDDPEVSVP